MRKIILALTIALAAAAPAGAGSATDPEVTDPAGDAVAIRTAGSNDPSLDVRSAWFEPVHSDGVLTGFAVNVEMASAPTPDSMLPDSMLPDSMLMVGWALEGTDCFGMLSLFGPMTTGRHETPGGTVVIDGPDNEAFLDYGCRSEDAVNLDLLRIRIDGRSVRAGLSITDNVWRTLVPLTAFDAGPSAGAYREGAVLDDIVVSSLEPVSPFVFVSVDAAPSCGGLISWECEGTAESRPYTLGT